MKRILSTISLSLGLVLLFSCKKDDINSSPGVLEGHFNDNPSIGVSKKTEKYIHPSEIACGIYRGYFFTPTVNIKITDVGLRVPGIGEYSIILTKGSNTTFYYDGGYIFNEVISISDTNNFQFIRIKGELLLSANERYLITYYNTYQNYYYEAKSLDSPQKIRSPLEINGIKIGEVYIHYRFYINGVGWTGDGGYGHGILKGFVDFKYELI